MIVQVSYNVGYTKNREVKKPFSAISGSLSGFLTVFGQFTRILAAFLAFSDMARLTDIFAFIFYKMKRSGNLIIPERFVSF